MSIQAAIAKHVAEMRLVHLRPAISGEEMVRTMFVGQEIVPLLDPAKLPVSHEGYQLAHVRPRLDAFIAGRKLNIALQPRDKDISAHFARTDPVTDEVWDIRCTDPPQIRVFGRFVDLDTYVALTWQYRGNLNTNDDWTDELSRFKAEWRKLFPNEPLFAPGKVEKYVSQPFKSV